VSIVPFTIVDWQPFWVAPVWPRCNYLPVTYSAWTVESL